MPSNRGHEHGVLKPQFVAASIVVATLFVLALALADEWLQNSTIALKPSPESTLAEDQLETLRKYQLFTQWTYQQNQRIYNWHAFSTKVIFWLSMFISVSGVGFAFWQFVSAAEEAKEAVSVDELEIKTQLASLAFKSRSIATLVLFVSVAYMLIYTLWIYPIQDAPAFEKTEGSFYEAVSEPGTLSQDILSAAGNDRPKEGGEG